MNKQSLIFILIILILSACTSNEGVSSDVPPITSAIQDTKTLSTLTLTPTKTHTPTLLPSQTEIPFTPTSSPMPKPSQTPTLAQTATPTPIFPLLTTPFDFRLESPTPLPFPIDAPENYQLKNWSEVDALDLVRSMDQYAFASDVAWPCEYRGFFIEAQNAVKLSVQEALLRFPTSNYRENLEWHLALTNAILSNPASDTWILNKLETGLNAGELLPEDIDEYIQPYGFRIVQSLPVPNLLGEDRLATVYWLKTQEVTRDGLFFSLSTNESGSYLIKPIHSHWNFDTAMYYEIVVDEDEQAGLPRIVLAADFCNCECIFADSFIYQFQGENFIDLTGGVIEAEEEISNWKYESQEASTADVIVDKLLIENKPIEAISMINTALGQINENDELYMTEEDLLLYLLGLAHELNEDQGNAVQAYWQLWQKFPASPYSVMAKTKLESIE